MKQMEASKTVIGLNALALWDEFGAFADWVDPALEMIAKHGKLPVVAAAIPFDRAADAHRCARAPERREGGAHTVIARRPASATSRPSAAASGAHASAAATEDRLHQHAGHPGAQRAPGHEEQTITHA